VGGKNWWLVVAPPEQTLNLALLQAFWIPGDCFIKLHRGTWHAGPYFEGNTADFYNLELSDTNISDRHTCDLLKTFGCKFEVLKQ
jgi:ureidoglycolate hydrolase